MKKEILGVKIDDINMDHALEIVKNWLSKGGKHSIVTPNPEIVMMAQKDQELKNSINNADLAVPDGVGLRLTGDIVCNTPGIDLMEELVKSAADLGLTTGFLGGKEGLAKKAAECLLRKYPKLKISFAGSGGQISEDGELQGEDLRLKIYDLRERNNPKSVFINPESLPKADVLFVAFGPPKQEKWIAKNLDKLPIKLAMGVGGSFDYITGNIPRAPKWTQNLGFEWLFRLIIQPWRIKRQISLIHFLWLLTKNR